jgi:hypothetical protein
LKDAVAASDSEGSRRAFADLLEMIRPEIHTRPPVTDRRSWIEAQEVTLRNEEALLIHFRRISRLLATLSTKASNADSDSSSLQSLMSLSEAMRALLSQIASSTTVSAQQTQQISELARRIETYASSPRGARGSEDIRHAFERLMRQHIECSQAWLRLAEQLIRAGMDFKTCDVCGGVGQVPRSAEEIQREAEAAIERAMGGGRTSRVILKYRQCHACNGHGRLWSEAALQAEQELFFEVNSCRTHEALISECIADLRS